MAATTQQQPNGVPNFKIVERLDSVPVVHDSLAYAESLINSTQLTSNLYQTALNLATRSVEVASPVIQRAKPLIESADGLAVATFDRVEATFPIIKTPTADVPGVKQARAVYDARVAPLMQQAQPVIQEVINKTTAINNQLGATASSAIQHSTEFGHHLSEQLHVLTEQGKELPHQLLEGLTKVTNDVKQIVLAKDGTVQEKTNKLMSYVIDQVKPIVDDIYRHVVGATKAAEDKAVETNETVKAVTEKATEKAQEKAQQAQQAPKQKKAAAEKPAAEKPSNHA